VRTEAERQGYTKTFFGRRRYFEGLRSKIPYIKAAAERMAINAPIQGTSADVIKLAMKNVDLFLRQSKLEEKAHLLLQIHDELIYEIDQELLEEVAGRIKNIIQEVIPPEKTLGVPIVANVSVGDNWGEMSRI
jgi:DNA polymerase-1